MKRRIGAGILTACMALSLALPAAAKGMVAEHEAAEVVSALNIMVGDEKGDLNLDKGVTRAEFTTIAVKASPVRDQVGEASTSPYPDVPRKHWAAGYVQAGVKMGVISGYLDGTFRPDSQITLAEGATIALKLLGYTGADFTGAYPTAQMAMYRSLELDRGISAKHQGDALTRRDTMYLFYNLLSVPNKNGQSHLNTLGYTLGADGEVDRVSLLGQVMEGPVVVQEGWERALPFNLSKATVYRSGVPSQVSAIQNGDLVYWNEGMARVWVYTQRITGTIQALMPSAANPTSVNVAGQTYSIETASAAYALSDLSGRRLGDSVTLLLGRTGGVAAVAEPQVGDQSKVGMVTALAKSSYSAENGSSYTADTVTILATDGKYYSYQWNTGSFEVGDLAQVTVNEKGVVALKRLREQSLSGKVSADGTSLGKYHFADDVEILDTYEGQAVRIYPQRLAGMQVKSEQVRYYTLDPQGDIQRLILEDATGDMHSYGMMTQVENMSSYMNIVVSYTMDMGGQTVNFVSQQKNFEVEKGGVQVQGSLQDPDKLIQLKQAKVERISGDRAECGRISFTLFDHLVVYEYRNGKYYMSNLDRVDDGGHDLTLWYDKSQTQGGSARIIVAKEID